MKSGLKQEEDVLLKPLGTIPGYSVITTSMQSFDYKGPLLHQQVVSGDEYRVHIIDEVVIAHKLQKRGLDYRLEGLSSAVENSLPKKICHNLRLICQAEGLRFGGIDLIISTDKVVLLEVNPMPGYHSYEASQGGKSISKTLYRVLNKPNF